MAFVRISRRGRTLGDPQCAQYVIDLKTGKSTCVEAPPDLAKELLNVEKYPVRTTPTAITQIQTEVMKNVSVAPPKQPSSDGVGKWLDKESIAGVKNGYLAGGLVLVAALLGTKSRKR